MMIAKDSWKIDVTRTALINIDMQRAYLQPISPRQIDGAREFIPKLNQLIERCRQLDVPVIHVYNSVRADFADCLLKHEVRPITDSEWEVVEGRKGVELYKELHIAKTDYMVKKIRYSAFIPGSSTLGPLLQGLSRDILLVCGILTHTCVFATVADAMMLGYRVFVVADLTASINAEWQKVTLHILDKYFSKVVTYRQVVQELK